jgi:hypothetical protein
MRLRTRASSVGRRDSCADSYAEWREEWHDLEAAYHRWVSSRRVDRNLAFRAYRAALEREAKAALVCELTVERLAVARPIALQRPAASNRKTSQPVYAGAIWSTTSPPRVGSIAGRCPRHHPAPTMATPRTRRPRPCFRSCEPRTGAAWTWTSCGSRGGPYAVEVAACSGEWSSVSEVPHGGRLPGPGSEGANHA